LQRDEGRGDRFAAMENRFAGYAVYDQNYEKIGEVDDLFINEADQPEYIGVKMGLFGTKSTLIPFEVVRVNDRRKLVEVAASKDLIQEAPAFDDDQEITPELEGRIRRHFGLTGPTAGTEARAAYGGYYGTDKDTGVGTTAGEVPATPPRTGVSAEDELRVQRAEEELRVGTRKREVGKVRVHKRVRTERERLRVPKKREEITVERVPVGDEPSPEVEIADEEIRVPVIEEEVVVEKHPVAKEEIRIRKEIVEDSEVVEEEVRREEVDIDDATDRRAR
jgi:uncharacterized protein (TIGR02271 family)